MVVERVLVWFSGEDYELLQGYPRNQAPYLLIGAAVLASAVLAGTATVALFQLVSSITLAVQVVVGLLVAAASTVFDRFLVTALIVRGTGRGRYVAALIFRALLGAVSASFAATLIVAQVAPLDVNIQIAAAQLQNRQAFYAALNKSKLAEDITAERELVTALRRPDPRVQNLEGLLKDVVQVQEQAAYYGYNCLRYGTGTCQTPDPSAAERWLTEYDADVRQAKQISAMILSLETAAEPAEAKLPTAESQLNSNIAAQEKLIKSFQASNNDPGLPTRLLAVYRATNRAWARVGWWVFIIFFLIVGCVPVVRKWRLTRKPETPYELAREEAQAGSRKQGGFQSMPDESDAEPSTAREEINRIIAAWDRKIPSTSSEVNGIGSTLTSALMRDWANRREQ